MSLIVNDLRAPTLYVGNIKAAELLEKIVKKVKVVVDPRLKDDDDVAFIRDSLVVLHKGTALLPYSIEMPERLLDARFRALLPKRCSHFVGSHNSDGLFMRYMRTGYGNGFVAEHREAAKGQARAAGLQVKSARTCIEGGNCRLFRGADGRPKAIIGWNSLILSLIALDEQVYFLKKFDALSKIASTIEKPSPESVRMARNLLIQVDNVFTTNQKWQEKLLAPIEEETSPRISQMATQLQAKLIMTKSLIARELGILEKDMLVVAPARFHLDMELFVDNEGVVFMHDEQQALSALSEIEETSQPRYFARTYGKYQEDAQEKAEQFKEARKAMRSAIEAWGCKVVNLPGIFEGAGEKPVNFMNGLYVGPQFLTNGASGKSAVFQEIFSKHFKAAEFVDGHLMQTILQQRGGLNCITWLS